MRWQDEAGQREAVRDNDCNTQDSERILDIGLKTVTHRIQREILDITTVTHMIQRETVTHNDCNTHNQEIHV